MKKIIFSYVSGNAVLLAFISIAVAAVNFLFAIAAFGLGPLSAALIDFPWATGHSACNIYFFGAFAGRAIVFDYSDNTFSIFHDGAGAAGRQWHGLWAGGGLSRRTLNQGPTW